MNNKTMEMIHKTYDALQTNDPIIKDLISEINAKYRNDVNLSYYVGIYYERSNEYETASKYFEKCLKLNPFFVPPYFNLSEYYNKINNPKWEELLQTVIKMKEQRNFSSGSIDDKSRMHAYAILSEQYKNNDKKRERLLLNVIELLENRKSHGIWDFVHVESWKNAHKILSSIYAKKDMELAYKYCMNGINVSQPKNQQNQQNLVELDNRLHRNKIIYMNYIEHKTIKEDYKFIQNNSVIKDKIPIEGKIKIGYISPDFNKNAVGLFLTALLKDYNKEKFEVYCYYSNYNGDEFTNLFKSYIEPSHWFNISFMEEQEIANLINSHNINILFDLICYDFNGVKINYNIIKCPTIINYLGFPNTSGMAGITHRITDKIADPITENRQYYSEKLVYMPRCFLCYTLFENTEMPEIKPRIQDGKVYLGVMNKTEKQNEKMRNLWHKILLMNGNAVLCIKLNNPEDKKLYVDFPKKQIKFFGFKNTLPEYLSLFNEIDLSLDTYPYSGTTTTCSSLLMGIPVITMYKSNGQHVSNVSASIMRNMEKEYEKYVCVDENEYIRKINAEIKNTVDREKVRRDFLQLMDRKRFMEEFENELIKLV